MKLKPLSLIAAALLSACASDVSSEEMERAERQPYDDELAVGVNVAALSNITTIGEVCGGICANLAIAGDIAAVVQSPDDQSLALANLVDPEVASIPTTFRMGGAVASTDGFFFLVDITNKGIKRFGIFGNTWISATVGEVTGLKADKTWTYWTDGRGLQRAGSKGEDVRQVLLEPSMASGLVLLDGSKLYFTREINNGVEYELRKFDQGNWSNTLLRTSTTPLWGFSQDATHIYWVDGGPTYRLRRMNKSTLAINTVRSTTKIPGYTAAKDGVLYWSEVPAGGGNVELMKRTAAGVITTERSGRRWIGSLEITPTHLFWLDMKADGDPMILKRAVL